MCGPGNAEEAEQRKKSEAIDKKLKEDNINEKTIKLLLLGKFFLYHRFRLYFKVMQLFFCKIF
jgi:hypothetical protein